MGKLRSNWSSLSALTALTVRPVPCTCMHLSGTDSIASQFTSLGEVSLSAPGNYDMN